MKFDRICSDLPFSLDTTNSIPIKSPKNGGQSLLLFIQEGLTQCIQCIKGVNTSWTYSIAHRRLAI